MPSRDGAEDDFLRVVTDLLDVTLDFLSDLQESGLVVRVGSSGVHFVDTNDEHGAVGLRSSSDHVLDEIPVSRGVDDGDVIV